MSEGMDMKAKVWRGIGLVFSVVGLVLCILAVVKNGQQPLPILGLLFVNLGLWSNIIVTRKERKEGEKQDE